jgi:hypothetical protein
MSVKKTTDYHLSKTQKAINSNYELLSGDLLLLSRFVGPG